jgi:two-component system capsular synthesis response regulator RcsB
MADTRIRVVIADDYPVVIEGIRACLERNPAISVVATANDTRSLADALDREPCDLVISDIGMAGIDGGSNSIAFLRRLLRQTSRPFVLVVTMIAQRQMYAGLLHCGVDGIIDKRDGLSCLPEAIDVITQGGRFVSSHARELMGHTPGEFPARAGVLSAREWEVFRLYASGASICDIASRLNRSRKTIATQKRSAMRKLGLDTELDLVNYFQQLGMV